MTVSLQKTTLASLLLAGAIVSAACTSRNTIKTDIVLNEQALPDEKVPQELIDPSAVTNVVETEILVFGASLGGLSAAIATSQNKIDTLLVSNTDRLGGMAVDTGLSAFDAVGQRWENTGLVEELRQFLFRKYPTLESNYLGLGKGLFPSIASPPGDIEEFFTEKTASTKHLTIKKNYELKRILRASVTATGAIFVSRTNPKDTMLVRFKDFIDATETSKALGMTGNFNVGFDTREETNDPSAFPRQVRDFLVRGYSKDGKATAGIGNRTQATGVVFNIFDKGYTGEFYGISSKNCQVQVSDAKPFLIGGKVQTLQKGCSASFAIKPDFSDTYDLFFINHSNESIKMDIDMLDGYVLPAEKAFASSKDFVQIGSYYFDNNRTSFVTIKADKSEVLAEGIILVKRNSQYPPILSKNSGSGGIFNMQNDNAKAANATLYANFPKANPKDRYTVTVNQQPFTLKQIAGQTWAVENVPLRPGTNAVILKTPDVKNILGVFTGPSTENTVVFNAQNGTSTHDAKGSNAQWKFKPKKDGGYVLTTDWNPPLFSTFKISKVGALSVSSSYRAPITNMNVPVLLATLKAGEEYTVDMVAPSVSDPAMLKGMLIPIEHSGIMSKSGATVTFGPDKPGMFDIWIKNPSGKNNILKCTYIKKECPLSLGPNYKGYQYGGRFFLGTNEPLVISGLNKIDVLAMPNHVVDVYKRNIDPSGLDTEIKMLTQGKYTVARANGTATVRPVVTHSSTQKTQTGATFIHSGVPFTISFEPENEAPSTVYLYESLPTLTTTFKQFRTLFSAKEWNMFAFRNILANANVPLFLQQKDTLKNISSNSYGMTLVLDYNSDYTPVLTHLIDDPSLYELSKEQAYAYYYWLKWDTTKNEASLGCSPLNLPVCDSRRIQMVLDVFDTEDGFPVTKYTREGRRAKTVKPITESDLLLKYLRCDECTNETCLELRSTIPWCFTREQAPVLFEDALGAAFYPLDFHAFFTKEEFAAQVLNKFMKTMDEEGLMGEDEEMVFRRSQRSAPAEITAGSLIPADGSNIFPGSTNFGVTQVSNSGLRTHLTEITVGNSIGELLSYAQKNGMTPLELYSNPEEMRKLQHSLVEKGAIVYPIDDMMDQSLTIKAVQHLIIDKKITIVAEKDKQTPVFRYYAQLAKAVTKDDIVLGKELDAAFDEKYTFAKLLKLFPASKSPDAATRMNNARKIGLLDDATTDLKADDFEHKTVTKGALYKAYYLLKGNQWK